MAKDKEEETRVIVIERDEEEQLDAADLFI